MIDRSVAETEVCACVQSAVQRILADLPPPTTEDLDDALRAERVRLGRPMSRGEMWAFAAGFFSQGRGAR